MPLTLRERVLREVVTKPAAKRDPERLVALDDGSRRGKV